MKIGKINRLAKAGELVSVRLLNGQTISAKAGNDLRSATVLVSKTQSGWFAFASQGETKAVSTQIVNRRPRQVTPEIYPVKVLFSIEVDDRIEFYIGGDRSIPVKIWELQRENDVTEIRKAVINSTGNKPNDWIVSIQYFRYVDTIEIPEEYQGLPPNSPIIQGVESSAIITSNNTTIHVGTNEIDPIGKGWFAPDAINWFKTNPDNVLPSSRGYFGGGTQIDLSNELLVGENAITQYLATETDPVELYDISDTGYTTQIGSLTGFEYLDSGDFGGGTRYIFSDLWTPTNEYILSDFLDWDTTKTYSDVQIIELSNDLAPDFYEKAYAQSMTFDDVDLIESHAYTQPNDNLLYFDADYLRIIQNSNSGIGLGSPTINTSSVSAISQDNSAFNHRYPSIEKEGAIGISGRIYSNGANYSFRLGSYDSDGVFRFPLVDDTGFNVQSATYGKVQTDYAMQLRLRGSLLKFYFFDVIKSSASGSIELMGESISISLAFLEQEEREDNAFNELHRKKSGTGETLIQKGLDNSAIGHGIGYEWEEYKEGFDPVEFTFPITPSYTETTYYYSNSQKYPLATNNSDFEIVAFFGVSIEGTNAYTGMRLAPNFKGEDVLENNKISRVAWSDDDGESLKQNDIELDVKTYRIVIDGSDATIPDSSKIKTFTVKKLAATPSIEDAVIYSMSCYFT